jgi:hypothetical protein
VDGQEEHRALAAILVLSTALCVKFPRETHHDDKDQPPWSAAVEVLPVLRRAADGGLAQSPTPRPVAALSGDLARPAPRRQQQEAEGLAALPRPARGRFVLPSPGWGSM